MSNSNKEYNLVIDADSILYTSCYRNQSVNLKGKQQYTAEEIRKSFNLELAYMDFVSKISLIKSQVYKELELDNTNTVNYEIFFSVKKTFRNKLTETYKANRKPSTVYGISELKELIIYRIGATIDDIVEADDMVMTRAYQKDNVIIACIDKDIYTHSPAPCINYKTWEWFPGLSQEQIEINYWKQALQGDSVDGIKGAKGIGKVKANNLVDERNGFFNYYLFVEQFETEAEAILNMRLVRMDQYLNNKLELWNKDTPINKCNKRIVIKENNTEGFSDLS